MRKKASSSLRVGGRLRRRRHRSTVLECGAVQGAGAVNVLDGSADGLTVIGNRIFTEGSAGVRFGFPIAIGDLSNDEFDDLAIAFDGGPEIAPHHRFHL